MHNVGMDADLDPMVAALAELTDTEPQALIAATNGVPQTAPGLLAWIDGAWVGVESPTRIRLPAVSIDAAMAMRATLARDDRAEDSAVLVLFDEILKLLTGSGRKQ
jgi:hypothetical protein